MVNPLPCFITVVALLLSHAPAASPDEAGEPQIHRPGAGEYQHLWLNFEGGGGAAKAFVGMRAGRSTTAWFLNGEVPGGVKATDAYRVLLDAHDVSISGDALRGKIVLRQVSVWQPKHLAEVTLSIDAKRSGGDFTGTWTGEVTGGKKSGGACRGSLADEAAIRAAQSFAPDAAWPGYHGPHAANRAAGDGRALVEELSQARPVWRAEQPLLSGWGTGVDARYTWRAAVGTVCGGAGTPVVARGRVYLFHYTPAGEPDAKVLEKVLADFTSKSQRGPLPAERALLVDYSRPFADTVVTCLDAGTGALQWRTTFPRWAGNIQTHKWRGLNPTAAVVGTVVIASDYSQNWVALDAENGDVLWTLKRSRKIAGNQALVGAVPAGAMAILPSTGNEPGRAVEPRTGRVVWQQPGGPQALVWGKPGAERVLFIGRDAPACHDAATGTLLWKMDEKLHGVSGSAALTAGDMLVGHILPDAKQRGGFFQGWKLADTGATKLWQDEFLPYDENLTVTLGADRAYVVGKNEIRCLDLATGRLLGKRAFDEKTAPVGSNQWLALIGNRLLLAPEGQHGSLSLELLDATPGLESRGGRWSPPNNSTTAYAVHALGFPVADGRLFVRGMDGLYCYDLRAAGK